MTVFFENSTDHFDSSGIMAQLKVLIVLMLSVYEAQSL